MLAAVDIGSNSVKYLFARSERGVLTVEESDSWITRLGKRLNSSDARFDEDSLQSTHQALLQISDRLKANSRKLKHVEIVATAAARNARNPEVLEELVKKSTGFPLKIISGEEEARLSMKGAGQAATQHFPQSKFVFMDIGGASTEVGFLRPEFLAHSFQGGALKCHEGLKLDKMPVSDKVWQEARYGILDYFPEEDFSKLLKNYEAKEFKAIAVGGTLLLAAELCENLMSSKEGTLVSKSALEELSERVRSKSIRARKAMTGMNSERADILPAGILILTACLNRLGQEEVFVTPWGLRHGILSELM